MLPHEIEPFAQAHQDAIEKIRDEMTKMRHAATDSDIKAQIDQWRDQLSYTYSAFIRFKVCMADEVRQKEQNRDKILHCRLHHKNQ